MYSNTGWAAPEWASRVSQAEALVRSYGFIPVQIESEGFVPLAIRKKGFPRNGMQFCTTELKVLPAQRWLDPPTALAGGKVRCYACAHGSGCTSP